MGRVILAINSDYFPENHLPMRLHTEQSVFGEE